MKRLLLIVIGVSAAISIMSTGCGGAAAPPSSSEPLSPSEIAAVKSYTDAVTSKLDVLYAKFEEGEAQAERIADEMLAPYQAAIGYAAEIRKAADEIQALAVPPGGQIISEAAIAKLRGLQAGLDEIASREPSEVSLSDPATFYIAYLDVLIEIPELKRDIAALAGS